MFSGTSLDAGLDTGSMNVIGIDRVTTERNQMNATDPMQMTSKQVRENCQLDDACQKLMHQAVLDLGLNSADHDNILRYAKSAANMAGYESINTRILLYAISHHQTG